MAKSDSSSDVQTTKKSGNKQQNNKDKQKPPTKIVIRHLPPTMTEEEFLQQIDPLPPHDFYYFAAADWSLGFDATCRAYITLKSYDDVFLFRDRFDGYVFVDSKGAEYAAIVEFAPFQGLLKNKSRRSYNKVNTIEEETHYQQFLVKLAEEREAAAKGGECKLEFNLNTKKEEITSTPLLQYLANKKEKRRQDAKKRTDEKRRLREEEKEKRQQVILEKSKQQQLVKNNLPENTPSEKREDKEEKKEKSGSVVEKQNVDEKQNSRARRRNDRNYRRHEAFMQRKINDRANKGVDSVKEEQGNTTEKGKENDKTNKQKERERERKIRREQEREKQKARDAAKKDIKIVRRNSTNDRKLNESNEKDVKESTAQSKRNKSTHRDSVESKPDDDDIKNQQSADEKRIRNKDRPSIAIYQPKARLRASEESDTGTGGGRQSDGERVIDTPKTEEVQRPKKVSRYSERRNERRLMAKERRKSSAETISIETENQ